MRRTTGPRAGGETAVLAAAALWGTVGPARVWSGAPIDAAALGGWRLLVGGLALGLWATRRANPWRGLRDPGAWRWIALAAAATGIFQAAFLASVDSAGAALATVVALGVAPVATGLLARAWLGDRLGPGWALGSGLSVAGCVLLVDPAGSSLATPAGIGLAVLAGACYGAYTVAAKRLTHFDVSPNGTAAITLVLGAVPLVPAMAGDSASLGAGSSWALIAWLALGATCLAYALFVAGVRRTSASTAGVLSLAEPAVAAALGVLVLGESLSLSETLGALLLAVGLATALVVGRRSDDPLERSTPVPPVAVR